MAGQLAGAQRLMRELRMLETDPPPGACVYTINDDV
jgi:hypothetical protein